MRGHTIPTLIMTACRIAWISCPNDTNKIESGVCGCKVADADTDGDGTFDCTDTNGDNDGVPDIGEQGSAGNDPIYDGNDDGIADRLQNNVTSCHTYDDRNFTLPLNRLLGPQSSTAKLSEILLRQMHLQMYHFLYGFFEFTINGVSKGGTTTVRLYFPIGTTFDTYFKFGPTAENSQNHWYEFLYDGQTGAEINGNVITLHFVDGLTGDDDLMDNGIIIDVGGPGNFAAADNIVSGADGADGSGGGGGDALFPQRVTDFPGRVRH